MRNHRHNLPWPCIGKDFGHLSNIRPVQKSNPTSSSDDVPELWGKSLDDLIHFGRDITVSSVDKFVRTSLETGFNCNKVNSKRQNFS